MWRRPAACRAAPVAGSAPAPCTLCSSEGTLRTTQRRVSGAASGRSPSAWFGSGSGRQPTFSHEARIPCALALRHPCLALDVLVGTCALARAGSISNVTPAARSLACRRPAIRSGPNAASAQGALPRASGVAHMKRRLRTQCSSLAHPAHFDVVSLHDGSAGWRSATAGRREAGEAGAERHALQLRRHSAHHAHATLSGAAGGRVSSARFGLWAAAHLPS